MFSITRALALDLALALSPMIPRPFNQGLQRMLDVGVPPELHEAKGSGSY